MHIKFNVYKKGNELPSFFLKTPSPHPKKNGKTKNRKPQDTLRDSENLRGALLNLDDMSMIFDWILYPLDVIRL